MSTPPKHDYPALIAEYEQRLAGGESKKAIEADFNSRGIHPHTFQNNRTQWHKAQRSTPERTEVSTEEQYTQEHHGTLPDADPTEVHLGTLEGHQEVMADVYHSVPEAPRLGIEEPARSTLEPPSTPIVHPEVSPDDSTMAHSGVPARQDDLSSTPMVHPSTPSAEDWRLWEVMKTRWEDVEKMLADWQTRHTLLRTPRGTPRHTIKKTYVVDSLYIELIDRYAQEQGVELKDVVNLAFHEFFERREYLPKDTR
jgi:hypothetical protein